MKVKSFEWSKTKNEWLKRERGISFEEIANNLNEGKRVDTYRHLNQEKYPDQKVFVLDIANYAYLVPFVEDDEKIFLKTIFRSRKATKKYLKNKGGKDG